MRQIEVVFEKVEINREETKIRLNKAFEILFSEVLKVTDLGNLSPQNYVRAEEVRSDGKINL